MGVSHLALWVFYLFIFILPLIVSMTGSPDFFLNLPSLPLLFVRGSEFPLPFPPLSSVQRARRRFDVLLLEKVSSWDSIPLCLPAAFRLLVNRPFLLAMGVHPPSFFSADSFPATRTFVPFGTPF